MTAFFYIIICIYVVVFSLHNPYIYSLLWLVGNLICHYVQDLSSVFKDF